VGKWTDVHLGWFSLVAGLDKKLALIDPTYGVLQCKSKFGGLRCYAQPHLEDRSLRPDEAPSRTSCARGADGGRVSSRKHSAAAWISGTDDPGDRGDEPVVTYVYTCEVCDKTAELTAEAAYQAGCDMPPIMGTWGTVSPRTCDECGIQDTAWFALVSGTKPDQLSDRRKTAIERILTGPESALPRRQPDQA